jgi:hypothetical protein
VGAPGRVNGTVGGETIANGNPHQDKTLL